jgi:hypothetical protein
MDFFTFCLIPCTCQHQLFYGKQLLFVFHEITEFLILFELQQSSDHTLQEEVDFVSRDFHPICFEVLESPRKEHHCNEVQTPSNFQQLFYFRRTDPRFGRGCAYGYILWCHLQCYGMLTGGIPVNFP